VTILNILIVDDDAGCLDSLRSSLELYSHNCEAFTLPRMAVEAYKKNPSGYQLVITDMKMPSMTGMQLLKKIKEINRDAKVIIITAYGDVETAMEAVNNHAYAFFGKPLNFQELIETIDRIENENAEKKLTKEEYARLAEEYSKLKKAFMELKKLLHQEESAK